MKSSRSTHLQYRNPDQLPDGGVLVVGAAATGIQLADEIQRSGRQVTISVGEHVRMPRTYRGRDIEFWMDAIGRLDERYDEVEEILKARKVASPQLIGTAERRTLDLNCLVDGGVQLRGRLGTIRDGVAMFSGGLRNHCALADQKLGRLLGDIDDWINVARSGARSRAAAAVRTDPRHGRSAAHPRPAARRDWFGRLGDGFRFRSLVGGASGVRQRQADYVTTAAWSTPPGSTTSAALSYAGDVRASYTAPPPTPSTWPITSRGISPSDADQRLVPT